MSATTIIGAIATLGTIVGGIVYIFKYSAWALIKTSEQKKESIDADVAKEQREVEKSGRPKS